jgi:hypothetical protein
MGLQVKEQEGKRGRKKKKEMRKKERKKKKERFGEEVVRQG